MQSLGRYYVQYFNYRSVVFFNYCYYNNTMLYEWDEDKRKINIEKHGIDFAATEQFGW